MLATLVAVAMSVGAPAHAQFSFFGPREASLQDISDTIAEHGFRLVGPLYRNGRVYLADVIDRRQRRERLVIAVDSGRIVQRFLVDVGPERRAPAETAVRPAPRDESFFSHLTRGWDDEPAPRPPIGLNGPDDLPPAVQPPAAARPKPQPRVVTRTDVTPVTASPLPPPPASAVPGPTPQDGAAGKPEVVMVPSAGSQTPAAGTPAPSGVRGTSVATDPLRIPGTRKAEEPKPAATVATKTPEAIPAAKPKAPVPDVAVAPLD